MKAIIKSLFLSAVVSWHVTMDADVTSTWALTQTSFSMDVTSDAGGYASLACVSHGLDMSCTNDGSAESSQGGFALHNLSCAKKCCSATITTKDSPMDYSIELCAHCLDSEVEKVGGDAGGGSTRLTTRGCYGTKGYSFYEDGRIETIGGVGNPTLKYKVHGGHSNSGSYKAHESRNHRYKYNSYGESIRRNEYSSHEGHNHGRKYNLYGKLNHGRNYQ